MPATACCGYVLSPPRRQRHSSSSGQQLLDAVQSGCTHGISHGHEAWVQSFSSSCSRVTDRLCLFNKQQHGDFSSSNNICSSSSISSRRQLPPHFCETNTATAVLPLVVPWVLKQTSLLLLLLPAICCFPVHLQLPSLVV